MEEKEGKKVIGRVGMNDILFAPAGSSHTPFTHTRVPTHKYPFVREQG